MLLFIYLPKITKNDVALLAPINFRTLVCLDQLTTQIKCAKKLTYLPTITFIYGVRRCFYDYICH